MGHGPVGWSVEEDNHESREIGLNPVAGRWLLVSRWWLAESTGVCVVCTWHGRPGMWELNANGGTEVDEDR